MKYLNSNIFQRIKRVSGLGLSLCAFVSLGVTNTVVSADTVAPKQAFVQMLEKSTTGSNALLTLIYDRGDLKSNIAKEPSSLKFQLEDGSVLLLDDGLGGDKVRGDGIYSGETFFDFDALMTQYKELYYRQRKTGEPTLLNHFNGRQLVRTEKIDILNLAERLKAGFAIPLLPLPGATIVEPDASLVILDPGVIEDPNRTFDSCTGAGDPNGIWTFKHLMTEMANSSKTGVSVEDFTRMWLTHWEANQNINGFNVPHRLPKIRSLVIDPWEAASGGAGMPLNLDLAPFKLLSIVNRVDLRDNSFYGGSSAGEGRFVFAVQGPDCNQMQFTVIFEYGIEKRGCFSTKAWGQRWADLNNFVIGSPAYNAALQIITESFVSSDAAPHKPNGSALNQLRTNEISLNRPFPNHNWELREFVISGSGWNQHFLAQDTVKLTPDLSLNGTATLASFINSPVTPFPLRYPAIVNPFTGGHAETPFGVFWNAPGIVSNQDRHEFSLNTCNGCHAGETNTFFTHINPGPIPAALSGFMTGINVVDPVDGTVRHFDDIQRRKDDLEALVNNSCLIQLPRLPLLAVH